MNNGTIEHTDQFKAFKDYVIGKYGTMSHFSKILLDDFRKLTCIERKIDNQETRDYIWELERMAQQLKYDKSKVFISDEERAVIETEVIIQCKLQGISKVQLFLNIHYEYGKYYRIINCKNPYKNESYNKLMNILFN